jgi:hypothetical protein
MNRFLLIGIGVLLLLGLTGYATTLNQTLKRNSSELITVAKNLGIIMMLVNGTFISTSLFKVALFLIGLAILGFIFKIMHLQGADELLLYPFIILFCLYFVHFIKKNKRRRVDVLKLGTLLSFLVLPPFIMLHILSEDSRELLVLVSHVLFWVTFLDFLYTLGKEGALLRR